MVMLLKLQILNLQTILLEISLKEVILGKIGSVVRCGGAVCNPILERMRQRTAWALQQNPVS
jgi:hypothetical protein